MKRLLCMMIAGLLLLGTAACTVDPLTPQTTTTTDPGNAAESEATPEPEDSSVSLTPIENPPIQPGEQIDNPPIELTDPIQPIYETEGTEMTVNGYADFAHLLSAAILSGTQNQNLSPISVYLALAMVAEGASGDTQAELLALLGCKDLMELRGVCGGMLETLSVDTEHSTLDIHNSLWMAETINGQTVSFRPEYLGTLSESYRSEANVVEFGTESASKQIADWINKHTRGKINVSPNAFDFDPSTLAVLINTIYLKDGWRDTFNAEETEPDVFHAYTGEITADFMRRFDRNSSVRIGDGWMAYRVYMNRVGYITFVLPDEGVTLDKLLGTPDAINKLLHKGVEQKYDVSLRIPKFKFQDKMELTAVLEALGLHLSFTPEADFSGMSDMPCCIDSVIQESYIGVDENGVEAAAYTMVQMRTTAFNPVQLERLDFHLIRPFFYAIESFDGQVLFIGTVTNPTAGE